MRDFVTSSIAASMAARPFTTFIFTYWAGGRFPGLQADALIHPIDSDTRLCGVVGHPVGHSLSPAIHNAGYAALGLNFVYLAFDVLDLGACIGGFRAMHGFRGLSITIPHKVSVIPYLDEIDPAAAKIGSVNTVLKAGERLFGTSTDGAGTLRAFQMAGIGLEGQRVVFLGSGGAARAVAFAFADHGGPAFIRILGRTALNAEALAADLNEKTSTPAQAGDLESGLAQALDEADVIVHGTPVGMHGDKPSKSVVPISMLRPAHVVFDMVYRPRKTQLILDAERVGCKTVLGIEMLLHQAALQFELWTERSAPLDAMRRAAQNSID